MPLVSVITNIGLDHTRFLGDTLEKIAREKAGIIKKNIPTVIGETQEEIKHIFTEKAKWKSAPIYFADENYKIANSFISEGNGDLMSFDLSGKHLTSSQKLRTKLLGSYQTKNIITALKVIDILQDAGFNINMDHVREGLTKVGELTGITGRWQVLSHAPLIICDAGHNIDGIRQVLAQLKELKFKKLHFVFGTVNDKDAGKILELLPADAEYYFCKADIPRGLDQHELRMKANSMGLKGSEYPSVREAYDRARAVAGPEDLIFIGGSTFVVAEVL